MYIYIYIGLTDEGRIKKCDERIKYEKIRKWILQVSSNVKIGKCSLIMISIIILMQYEKLNNYSLRAYFFF